MNRGIVTALVIVTEISNILTRNSFSVRKLHKYFSISHETFKLC